MGYIENMNGLIPSLLNTATELNPNSFMGILQGYSVPGVDIQQCLDEHFQNKNSTPIYTKLLLSIIAAILLYFIIVKIDKF
jgi:hypothetical protein